MPPKPRPLKDRFWAKVRTGDGCWEWTGHLNRTGYGRINLGSRGLGVGLAHRVAWELAHGPIPPGLCVLHRCDNPKCVREDHLFLGTQPDNVHDMVTKGRDHHGAPQRGDRNGAAKLTQSIADAIRGSDEPGPVLAARYGISRSTVSLIRRGRRYWAA